VAQYVHSGGQESAPRSPNPTACSALRYALYVRGELWWDDEDAEHIRDRSTRYPGATDIEPDWTLEAAADEHRVVRDPDLKSAAAYVRIIGYSSSADFVLTVIVDPHDWSGVTAWKTRGADLRDYLEGLEGKESDR
jgi:hypothetical protein